MKVEYTLRDLFKRFIEEVCPYRRGGKQERYRLDKLMRDVISEVAICDLKGSDFACYITRQTHLMSSSINRDITVIMSVLAYARKYWRIDIPNISGSFERPQDPPPRDRRISSREVARIVAVGDPEGFISGKRRVPLHANKSVVVCIVFLLAIETAMRKSEILRLRHSDIDLEERFANIRISKNRRARKVPLSEEAIRLIMKMKTPKDGLIFDLNGHTMCTVFRRIRKRAGIVGVTFHDSRHEATTRLASVLDALPLSRVTGHTDLKMLLRYYNATTKELAHLIDAGRK